MAATTLIQPVSALTPDVSSLDFWVPCDWSLTERQMCDLEMLLVGSFAPLNGYMGSRDYHSVISNMRLSSGELWPIPIVLAIPKDSITKGTSGTHKTSMKLRDTLGTIVASLAVEEVYDPDLDREMQGVLQTTNQNHPYVQYLLQHHRGCFYVAGPVTPVHRILHFDFVEDRHTAAQVRSLIKKSGWEVVVGFQTRNPLHKSHFELTKQALREAEAMEGKPAHLLLTPTVGTTQVGDIDGNVRVRCYRKILKYYDKDEVTLVLLPLAMRMAGPREALLHALVRKNYGCTHFIVGRDHAGPSSKNADGSNFYGPYDAHELLKSVQSEIGIKPILGKNIVYVGEEHGGYMQVDKIPPGVSSQEISGASLRNMLQKRTAVPLWFSFPEVIEELQRFYKPLHETGFCVYFTGLPCSGKSTLAVALEACLQERDIETRQITVLDADIIRTHLSKGLGFSRSDRSVNVRRIGYVASEIVKHGGICLVANIAPYEEDRQYNRSLISSSGGGYIETYVSTPLEVCEQRDVKELYKKARQGVIKQFTGISDPYEIPVNPSLVVNSSDDLPGKVQQVLNYLKLKHWVE